MSQTFVAQILALDQQLFHFGNSTARCAWLDCIAPVLSYTWLLWALGTIAFAVWTFRVLRHGQGITRLYPVLAGAVLILGTAGIVDIVTNTVKDRAGRLRPYQSLPYVHYYSYKGWQQNPVDFAPYKKRADSFFSGHAAHSMAAATIMASLCPPASPFVYAIPLLSGFSRVYMGKHYPSDVLGGWVAGWLIAMAARAGARRLRGRCKRDE